MLFWLIIFISLGFAFLGFKKGFFVMFATLFNLMFSVFISVLSTPLVLKMSPGFERHGYYAAGSLILLFILIFGLLQTFAWFYFLRSRDEYFPMIFDKVGAVILGFLCGYVICAVLVMMVCIMPITVEGKMNWFCPREKMKGLSRPGIVRVCDFLAGYSLECFDGDSEDSIDHLLELDKPVEEFQMPVLMPDGEVSVEGEEAKAVPEALEEDTSEMSSDSE
jgi:hypothetical protein